VGSGGQTMRISISLLKRTCLILPYLAFLFLAFYHFDFILDDPFISFRYARNLSAGHGLVFNPGERVEGYSNFLWIVLLTPFMKLGFSPVIVSKALGLVFGLLTIYCTFKISLLIFGTHTGKERIAFFSSVLTGFSWYFSLWSIGGLETSLFSFLVSLSIYALIKQDYLRCRPDWSFIPLGLAGMTRPEAPLFFVAFFLVKSALLFKNHSRRRALMAWTIGLTLIYGSYFAWRLFYYGQLLPNPYYAKTLGGTKQYFQGVRYVWDFLSSQGIVYLLILAAGAVGLLRLLLRNPMVRLACFLFSVYLGFIVYVGGDWMAGFRFFAQIFPIYSVLLASSLIELVDFSTQRFHASRFANLIVLLLFVALTSSSLYVSYRNLRASVPWLGDWFNKRSLSPAGPYYDVALYLKNNVPEESSVALGEAGIIPYYASNIRVIDILGLMDLHVARIPGLLHEKGDAEYVLRRNPDYILLIAKEDVRGVMRYAGEPMRQFYRNRNFTDRYRLVFKLARGESEGLRDMFYLYRRSDLPAASLNLEALGFKESSDVRVSVSSSELVAGKSSVSIHIMNLNASAIDLFYTLNGEPMPILHAWPLDSNHTASVFVGSTTPKGLYVFKAIRDSKDSSPRAWIRTELPVVVK